MGGLIASKLERVISASRAALDRLDEGNKLSAILPIARSVADLEGDQVNSHWLDCEMYGLPDVPFAKKPRRTRHEEDGVKIFLELHSVEDVRKLTLSSVQAEGWGEVDLDRDQMILTDGIAEIERLVDHVAKNPLTWAPSGNDLLRAKRLDMERQRVLDRVRSYLHQYLFTTWMRNSEEIDNLALLGPDYRLVVDYLDAFETGVGNELRSALGLIRSTNPADWSAAALVCRNVILVLGRTLLVTEVQSYESAILGKPLDLKGEKEKNRLSAYIDIFWDRADDSTRQRLRVCFSLVESIYMKGSKGKGKSQIRHAEAKELVVSTFQLVAGLAEATGLQTVEYKAA